MGAGRPADVDPVRLIGQRLDEARRRRGWTYREFAARTGMSKSALHHLVRKRRRPPEYFELRGLVERLGERWDDEWERLWANAVAEDVADPPDGPDRWQPPAQLPAAPRGFVGRAAELGRLDELAAAGPGPTIAVCGTAGVGKTALVVRWAHRARGRFPDGELHVDLRGYDPGEAVSPADAIVGLLRALGVADELIPFDADQRAAAYRSAIDGRRTLLILDNARSPEHVRSLLPGAATCVTIVTSRDSLAGLVARDGAQRLTLDPLPPDDAVALARSLVGDRAALADSDATRTLVEQCARLPLAVRVAAELAAARPATPLADLVHELTDARGRLDLLDANDDARTAVRSVLSWSYQHLRPDAARAFRLLGLHVGPDIGEAAAADLVGVTTAQARRLVRLLACAHLIEPAGPGRWRLHGLLRAYARWQCEAVDPEPDRAAAVARLVDHYVTHATRADELRRPAATAWLATERANLVATIRHAADHGLPGHATRLAAAIERLHAEVSDRSRR